MNESEKQALLDQLRGIQTPDVSAWPAVGWWLLLLCLLALLRLGWTLNRKHRARMWRKEAREELQRLRQQAAHQAVNVTLADCSRLARRLILVAHPRENVASLQGQAWLEALDKICQQPLFASGFGRLLESGPYERNPYVSQQDLDSLFDAIEELIVGVERNLSKVVVRQ